MVDKTDVLFNLKPAKTLYELFLTPKNWELVLSVSRIKPFSLIKTASADE